MQKYTSLVALAIKQLSYQNGVQPEPHHDGTAHWHLLLFVSPDQTQQMVEIRQFQQIGGPPVTVWRELRRLAQATDEDVETARSAADKSDWAGSINAVHGPCAKQADQPIKTGEWLEFDTDTGEYLDCPVNQYGEPSKGKLFGLCARGQYWITRVFRWDVKRPQRGKSSHAITEGSWLERLKRLTQVPKVTQAEIDALPADTAYTWEKLNSLSHPPPWSYVNNCTS